jgi:hypothetical protein
MYAAEAIVNREQEILGRLPLLFVTEKTQRISFSDLSGAKS